MNKKNVGRPGITKEQIKEAVKDLLQAGVLDPSSRSIRHALNDTGSFEAINKYLKELRTDCLRFVLLEETATQARLPETLQQAMVEIWERLQLASQAETLQVQESAAVSVAQAEEEKAQALDKVNTLEKALEKEQRHVNHLQADLKIKTDEWKIERERRIAFEARIQESEKNLQHLQEEAAEHFNELNRTHQEMLNHFKEQHAVAEKEYKQTIEELKTIVENQRQKYIVEVDQLKTAKNKLEQEKVKLTGELEQHIKRYQALEAQARGWEFDLQVAQQNHQASEKELIVRQTEMQQKGILMSELKTQIEHWQQKFEIATEQIGQLKEQLKKQQ